MQLFTIVWEKKKISFKLTETGNDRKMQKEKRFR